MFKISLISLIEFREVNRNRFEKGIIHFQFLDILAHRMSGYYYNT